MQTLEYIDKNNLGEIIHICFAKCADGRVEIAIGTDCETQVFMLNESQVNELKEFLEHNL